MSKIICEVCGTSYQDTTTQCPICGCVRPGNARSVADRKDGADNGGYNYVKGGRFSKANVRKRSKAGGAVPAGTEDEKGTRGLAIVAIVLLLAIIAVVAYIAIQFFLPGKGGVTNTTPETTQAVETTVDTTPVTIPCTSLKLELDEITLDKEGSAWMIDAKVKPADTTDNLTYTSSDETIATVSDTGKVTAVGAGETVITITCGEQSVTCTVLCTFEAPTEDTTAPTEETLPEGEEFRLNRSDITFSRQGDTWMLYSGSLTPSKITWTTDNSKVATIENGRVTAVGGGHTTVHGEFNGEKVSCEIRCSFTTTTENEGFGGNGGVSEDGGSSEISSSYKLKNTVGGNTESVTLSVGESFQMQLVDLSGNVIHDGVWTAGNSAVCTVANGVVTAVGSGVTTVSVTYNGQTLSFQVIV